ncbi:C40 family peptidase [Nocardioides sediminis]|uniref:C40 family peptidase n=1 Tax=Nocardioides sediminis TaxID=433648 RepID=UPI000D2FCF46|nr:C40 family peptidase [Nocardioides sediminis]
MPAIRRVARSCALSTISLAVAATATVGVSLAAAPAQADDREAVALNEKQFSKVKKKDAERRKSAARRESSRFESAVSVALAQRGDPYSYGASGPNAFDCSGLIQYSFGRAGIQVPRTSSAQAGATRRIAKSDMRPGDLMFFSDGGGVYHAGIFVRWDDGRAVMVHSPSTGRSVSVASPWTDSWFAGTLR